VFSTNKKRSGSVLFLPFSGCIDDKSFLNFLEGRKWQTSLPLRQWELELAKQFFPSVYFITFLSPEIEVKVGKVNILFPSRVYEKEQDYVTLNYLLS